MKNHFNANNDDSFDTSTNELYTNDTKNDHLSHFAVNSGDLEDSILGELLGKGNNPKRSMQQDNSLSRAKAKSSTHNNRSESNSPTRSISPEKVIDKMTFLPTMSGDHRRHNISLENMGEALLEEQKQNKFQQQLQQKFGNKNENMDTLAPNSEIENGIDSSNIFLPSHKPLRTNSFEQTSQTMNSNDEPSTEPFVSNDIKSSRPFTNTASNKAKDAEADGDGDVDIGGFIPTFLETGNKQGSRRRRQLDSKAPSVTTPLDALDAALGLASDTTKSTPSKKMAVDPFSNLDKKLKAPNTFSSSQSSLSNTHSRPNTAPNNAATKVFMDSDDSSSDEYLKPKNRYSKKESFAASFKTSQTTTISKPSESNVLIDESKENLASKSHKSEDIVHPMASHDQTVKPLAVKNASIPSNASNIQRHLSVSNDNVSLPALTPKQYGLVSSMTEGDPHAVSNQIGSVASIGSLDVDRLLLDDDPHGANKSKNRNRKHGKHSSSTNLHFDLDEDILDVSGIVKLNDDDDMLGSETKSTNPRRSQPDKAQVSPTHTTTANLFSRTSPRASFAESHVVIPPTPILKNMVPVALLEHSNSLDDSLGEVIGNITLSNSLTFPPPPPQRTTSTHPRQSFGFESTVKENHPSELPKDQSKTSFSSMKSEPTKPFLAIDLRNDSNRTQTTPVNSLPITSSPTVLTSEDTRAAHNLKESVPSAKDVQHAIPTELRTSVPSLDHSPQSLMPVDVHTTTHASSIHEHPMPVYPSTETTNPTTERRLRLEIENLKSKLSDSMLSSGHSYRPYSSMNDKSSNNPMYEENLRLLQEQSDLRRIIAQLESVIARLKDEANFATLSKHNELRAQQEQHDLEMKEIQLRNENELKSLERRHEESLNALRKIHGEELQSWKDRNKSSAIFEQLAGQMSSTSGSIKLIEEQLARRYQTLQLEKDGQLSARENLLSDLEDKARERLDQAEAETFRLKGILSHMEQMVSNLRGQNSEEKERLRLEQQRLQSLQSSLEAEKTHFHQRHQEESVYLKQKARDIELEVTKLNDEKRQFFESMAESQRMLDREKVEFLSASGHEKRQLEMRENRLKEDESRLKRGLDELREQKMHLEQAKAAAEKDLEHAERWRETVRKANEEIEEGKRRLQMMAEEFQKAVEELEKKKSELMMQERALHEREEILREGFAQMKLEVIELNRKEKSAKELFDQLIEKQRYESLHSMPSIRMNPSSHSHEDIMRSYPVTKPPAVSSSHGYLPLTASSLQHTNNWNMLTPIANSHEFHQLIPNTHHRSTINKNMIQEEVKDRNDMEIDDVPWIDRFKNQLRNSYNGPSLKAAQFSSLSHPISKELVVAQKLMKENRQNLSHISQRSSKSKKIMDADADFLNSISNSKTLSSIRDVR